MGPVCLQSTPPFSPLQAGDATQVEDNDINKLFKAPVMVLSSDWSNWSNHSLSAPSAPFQTFFTCPPDVLRDSTFDLEDPSSIHLIIHLLIHLCIHPSGHPSVCSSIHFSFNPYIHPFLYTSIHPFTHPPRYQPPLGASSAGRPCLLAVTSG